VRNKSMSKKEATHQRMLDSIHKDFRQHGYDGTGVDGLAKNAGVTSGAFYSHFGSKAKAFQEVVAEGVQQFTNAVEYYQQEYGEHWLEEFTNFYLGEKRTCDLSESCALQSLTVEVSRHNKETRSVFEGELTNAAHTFNKGMNSMDNDSATSEAWVTIAMLIGGATLARAVNDPELAETIVHSIKSAVNKKAKCNQET